MQSDMDLSSIIWISFGWWRNTNQWEKGLGKVFKQLPFLEVDDQVNASNPNLIS